MHLHSGHLVTSFEDRSNSKSQSSFESQSSPQSRLNMDPPTQDELRKTLEEINVRLGRLEDGYEEDNAYNGRNNNYRQGPYHRQDHHRDHDDKSAKHIIVEAPIFDGEESP